jgi:cellulose synthase/poly-beta-1,6-N-acetylglucosamine synthase-like glycosyltransferase
LDVGLRPEPEALFKMYTYMKKYPKVGGVCGYMSLKIEMIEEKDEMK